MDSIAATAAAVKRRRLTTTDRTLSVAIDNYAPPPPTISAMVSSMSPIMMEQPKTSPAILQHHGSGGGGVGVITKDQMISNRSKLYYMGRSQNSITHDDYIHSHYLAASTANQHQQQIQQQQQQTQRSKPVIRRSDTLGVHSSGMYEMEKSPSMMAKRTASMRHHTNDFRSVGLAVMGAKSLSSFDSANRRSCKMHRPFTDGAVGVSGAKAVAPPVVPIQSLHQTAAMVQQHQQHQLHQQHPQHLQHHQLQQQQQQQLHHRKTDQPRKETMIDTIKSHSLGDEDDVIIGGVMDAKRKLSPKFSSANLSFEKDLYRSRSNSRGNQLSPDIDIDAIETTAISSSGSGTAISRKHSSQSFEDKQHHHQQQQQQPYSFQRGSKHSHSFYLSPNSAATSSATASSSTVPAVSVNELTVVSPVPSHHSPRPLHDRRQHSASMRTRTYRGGDALITTKKSKSFISSEPPPHRYDRSPIPTHRRDSKIFTSIDDAKRSPRLSGNLLTPDSILPMGIGGVGASGSGTGGDSRKSSNMDISEMDYDEIIRLYQENRRKSSILLPPVAVVGAAGIGVVMDKKFKKKSLELNGGGGGGGVGGVGIGDSGLNENDEFLRKRKKIVCIIVTVFLSLVFASAFIVVFTLTHSIDAQVQNQTKKVYTFSRDRDMPIHYNVRQENERLMLESLNRAKYANKNFTDAVPLAAGEEIP